MKSGECSKTLIGHNSSVICLELVPGEHPVETLISGSWDKTIKIWYYSLMESFLYIQSLSVFCFCRCIKKGKLLKTLKGHKNSVMNVKVVSKDTLVSASSDAKIKIWYDSFSMKINYYSCIKFVSFRNFLTGNCLKTLHGHTDGVSCLKILNSDMLISGSNDNTLKIWYILFLLILLAFKINQNA